MIEKSWLIPLLPFLGFLINGLGRSRISKKTAAVIGSASVLCSFILSVLVFFELQGSAETGVTVKLFDWIRAGSLQIPFSFYVDPLTCVWLLVITGIGFLIHVYSAGYMHADQGFGKFFSYLNLFVFFMLILVMGAGYAIMFIGWEGVGLCSYLLIGFWYKNDAYNDAAKKAFIMNRIGDLGFLLGIFLLIATFGSTDFTEIFPQAAGFQSGDGRLLAITLCLFIGAVGKSAQLPLYTWLPDAMAGPTPVSALIHAATMVTAGVYMVARSNILYALSPVAMTVVAITGLATAIFAALIALTQNDIKKVLAYSTVSQLGYMFLALGVGAFTGAVFHVMTHAFFKALLFLGAGSVIHALHDQQDMRRMGGLKKAMPVTFLTMLLATLAISGIPPFSGFFSKDEILAHAFSRDPLLWVLGFAGALLTAFYMFRMLFLTFWGDFRGTAKEKQGIHESPASMTVPLILLAVLSVVGGFLGIPEVFARQAHLLGGFLAPVFAASQEVLPAMHVPHSTEWILMGISVLGVLVSIGMAWSLYVKKKRVPAEDTVQRSGLVAWSYHKFYVDELYQALIVRPLDALSGFFYRVMDKRFIDGIVNGVGSTILAFSSTLRLLQTGRIGSYLFYMVAGIILIFLLNYLIF